MDELERLLTFDEVASLLKVKRRTVDRWSQKRLMPVVKAGGLNRVKPADLAAWIEARTVAPPPPATQLEG